VAAFCTVGDVLEVLRLKPDDVDAAVLERCTVAASDLMAHAFDRSDDDPLPDPPPDYVNRFAVTVSIRLYRAKDAPFGVVDTWSLDGVGPVRLPKDPLYGLELACAPAMRAHGVG
jgi:hypothetical protein